MGIINTIILLILSVIVIVRVFDKEALKAAIYSTIITLLLVSLMCVYFIGLERDILIGRVCDEIEKAKLIMIEDYQYEVLNHKHKYSTGEVIQNKEKK
jgi:uncharacterized membrane protein YqjE